MKFCDNFAYWSKMCCSHWIMVSFCKYCRVHNNPYPPLLITFKCTLSMRCLVRVIISINLMGVDSEIDFWYNNICTIYVVNISLSVRNRGIILSNWNEFPSPILSFATVYTSNCYDIYKHKHTPKLQMILRKIFCEEHWCFFFTRRFTISFTSSCCQI